MAHRDKNMLHLVKKKPFLVRLHTWFEPSLVLELYTTKLSRTGCMYAFLAFSQEQSIILKLFLVRNRGPSTTPHPKSGESMYPPPSEVMNNHLIFY